MFSAGDLSTEVRITIDRAIEANGQASAAWVVQSVLAAHPRIEGPDKDFYALCANAHVRDEVRQTMRRYKLNKAPDPQIIMPGCERLQFRYTIERDGEEILVPIEQLTDSEVEAKIAELEAMADGCRDHARELRRYREQRGPTATAA